MLLITILLPAALVAQDTGLRDAAEQARRAWFTHDPAALIAQSPRVLIQLPGADPSVALGPAQAAALLADFLAPTQEVEVLVRAARQVEPGRGFVELQRRYRITGTQDVRSQILLLGYRLGRRGWSLVEFRVVG
ncbi:MAG TPA: hypothetical protein VJ808_05590 [Gemmatimonadales bacterium]|nr:hypothetical protein [Gemmatimonadales bacterium]